MLDRDIEDKMRSTGSYFILVLLSIVVLLFFWKM